jgi:TFIIF-interacting CTD phosphatase-like protein
MRYKKINVLLDLDQTIISSEAEDEYDFKNKNKAKKFNFHDMEGYYIVFERPGLQKFLDYLFDNFNVSIWTAASKDYSLFIIDKIILQGKSNRKLDWVFFSYHCTLSKKKNKFTKDLSIIWDDYKVDGYTKYNTVIIDDYDEVFKTQPNNCIIAKPFEFISDKSEDDNYLDNLIKAFTKMKDKMYSGKLAFKINKELGLIN